MTSEFLKDGKGSEDNTQALVNVNYDADFWTLFEPLDTSTRFVLCQKQSFSLCISDKIKFEHTSLQSVNYMANCIQQCQDLNETVSYIIVFFKHHQ